MSQLNRSASQQANPSMPTNTIYRIPPPPPSTPPIAAIDSLQHAAPQPPLRTNIKTTLHKNIAPQQQHLLLNEEAVNNRPQQSIRTSAQTNPNHQYENATNAAARLVYKSVMMGSVQSLNNQNQSTPVSSSASTNNQALNENMQAMNQHARNLSVCVWTV